jgi:hypothetical protein
VGAWGHGVLDDDFVRNVVGDFKDCLKRGESVDAASAAMLAEYGNVAGDPDDGPLLWLALAHCQWTYGGVSAEVLGHITADLDTGAGLERWADSPADLAKRRARLIEFVAKVREPNPKPSRMPKLVVRKPVFQPGDCLSIRLDDGRFGAALVLAFDHSQPEYGMNLIGVLDFVGDEPPDKTVFRRRLVGGRRWRRTTLFGGKTAFDVGWYLAYGFRTHREHVTVVGSVPISKADPTTSTLYPTWKGLRRPPAETGKGAR